MVQVLFRQIAPGQTLTAARAHVLLNGEPGYFIDTDGVRRYAIGDGDRTLGQLIDAGETFDVSGGLSILSGDGPPDDEVGRNGEQYYDREGHEMWGPKADGTWEGTSQGALAPPATDHGALTGLSDDDHTQYLTDARFDTRLATKNLDAVVDSATRLAMTSAERTKLTGVETDATADQTGAEIVAAIDAELGSDDWQEAGGGGGAPDPDSITNTELANMAQATLKGRAAGAGTGDPTDLTAAQARTLLNVADGANAYSHPNHSGDVTSSGDGATTIANDAVTNAKAANMAEATIKGRAAGAGTGDPTDLTAAQTRTILNVADGANAYSHPNHTGDVTSSGDGATTIAAGAVTLAKLADLAEARIMGRADGAGTGAPQALTAAQVLEFLGLDAVSHLDTGPWDDEATYNQFVALIHEDTLYLQADPTPSVGDDPTAGAPWTVLLRGITSAERTKLSGIATGANNYSHPNHTGDVTSSGDGATTIANDAVTNAKAANMAEATLKGRAAGAGTGDPSDLTATEARTLLNVENGATADQTGAEIVAAIDTELGSDDWQGGGGGAAPQESYFIREMFAGTSSVFFTGVAIGAGTVGGTTGHGALGLQGVVAMTSGGAAGNGYRFQTVGGAFEAGAGLLWMGRFRVPTNHTDKTLRFGFHDSSTTGAPTDGVYVEVVAGTATVYSVSGGTPTADSGTFTVAADTWYDASVYWTSATSVVVSIRATGGAMLDTRTITADLPSGSQQFGCGFQFWTPAGSAGVVWLDDMAYGIVPSFTP